MVSRYINQHKALSSNSYKVARLHNDPTIVRADIEPNPMSSN